MALDPLVRASQDRTYSHARRARKQAGQVTGPVPATVYAAILASRACVYCDGPAEHVDHVRPLAKGGWEHGLNLVPACSACNLSKNDKLLSAWNPVRVAHGVERSLKVAVELERISSQISDADFHVLVFGVVTE